MPVTAFWLLITMVAAAPAGGDTANSDVTVQSPPPAHDHPADTGRLILAPESGPVRVPFDLLVNHIYLRGRVNDSDSLWVVLDSGAGGNVIDATVAKRLGLTVTSMGRGRGAGGYVDAGQVPSVSVKLPGVTLDSVPISTMPLESFRRQSGRPMDVIVGQPLIERCVLRIDYASRMLEFLPAQTFQYAGKGAIVPLTIRFGHPYIQARITLPGHAPIKGQFVVDLGSSQAVILTPAFIEKQHVLDGIGRTIEARGRGVGGLLLSRVGRIPSVEVGGTTFERPITMLPMSAGAMVGAPDAIGNIGGEIMRRFTVTLDYSRKRMILEPNAQLREPFDADMSGLGARMGPDGSNALEVEWIQSDSPASEGGVQPNDLIERIDGRPALEIGVSGLRAMSRHDGERHVLSIRRGDQILEIPITNRRMI
jgi:hypothetical protein